MSKGWHVIREGRTVTVARALPVRFDLRVEVRMPLQDGRYDSLRLANQIRQDMWRSLQRLRGFRPAVRVEKMSDHVFVVAGGAVLGQVTRGASDALIELLGDDKNRSRWLSCASSAGARA